MYGWVLSETSLQASRTTKGKLFNVTMSSEFGKSKSYNKTNTTTTTATKTMELQKLNVTNLKAEARHSLTDLLIQFHQL